MRILLVCAGGFSTSLIAEVASEAFKGTEHSIEARPVSDVKQIIGDFDVVLVAPQAKYKLAEVQKIADAHGKKVGLLDRTLLSVMDSKRLLEQAENLWEG